MTSPVSHGAASWGSPTGGPGSKGNTAHLNLTRSLADVWGVRVMRVATERGAYLGKNRETFTLVRSDAWTTFDEGEARLLADRFNLQVVR
jgi:hypothetical protein